MEFEERCDQSNRPRTTAPCNEFRCPDWNYGDYSACDSNCFRHRQVICQDHNGKMISDDYCPSHKRPPKKAACHHKCGGQGKSGDNNGVVLRAKWKSGGWSAVSVARWFYTLTSDVTVNCLSELCSSRAELQFLPKNFFDISYRL